MLGFSILVSSLPLPNQRRVIRRTLLSQHSSLFGAPILIAMFPLVALLLSPHNSILRVLLLVIPLPRERSRSPKVSKGDMPLGQKALAQQLRFLHLEQFTVVDCGGQGDCAYLSIAAGLANLVGKTPDPVDLIPKGKLQAYLRCQAAKELRSCPADYNLIGPSGPIASKVADAGHWADSLSLLALLRPLILSSEYGRGIANLAVGSCSSLGLKTAKRKRPSRTQSFGSNSWITITNGCGLPRLIFGLILVPSTPMFNDFNNSMLILLIRCVVLVMMPSVRCFHSFLFLRSLSCSLLSCCS